MTHLPASSIWLGNAVDGRNIKAVLDSGIKAMVQLAVEEPPIQTHRELIYCRFPLLDGCGNRSEILFSAVTTLATLLKLGFPTLVCCSSGVNRSPAVAAAAMSLVRGKPPEEMLTAISEVYHCDVSPGLWQEVLAALPSPGR